MAKQATIELEIEEKGNTLPSVVVDNVHKVFLAGLGAAAMAQDELVNLLDKFVEQGENTEQKARDSINDMVETRKKDVEDANKRAEKEMNARIENTLHRLNIPTRSEIKALDSKITKLSKKIDELNKQAAA